MIRFLLPIPLEKVSSIPVADTSNIDLPRSTTDPASPVIVISAVNVSSSVEDIKPPSP